MASSGKTQRRAQTLLGVTILVLIALLGLTLWLNRSPEELLPEIIDKLPQNVDIGLDRVHYSQNQDGQRSWELDADRADYQREEQELRLTGVKLTFFNAESLGDITMTADRGVLLRLRNLIKAEGNVHIVAAGGETLDTEALEYRADQRLIESNKKMRFQSPQLILSGDGFRLDLAAGKLRIKHNARALIPQTAGKGERP